MQLRRAPLEDWMRDFYFSTKLDLGSSGVQCWSLGELRDLLDIAVADLDRIALDDSPSAGGPALRSALARRFTGDDERRVMATHGSSEAIFLVMNALLGAGDEVVVVDPGYHSLWSVAEAVGCRLRRWRLRPEDGFVPDLDRLRRLVTPGTGMVVVNFPNNPTGASLTRAQLDELLDVVAAAGAYLVWDGALTELTYGTDPLPEPALAYERCVSVGTMSKAYGLPGTRVGWCLAAPDLLARLLPMRDAVSICLSPLTEFVAARAVDGADRLLAVRRAQASRNLDALSAWMDANAHLVSWVRPVGGCTAFPHIRGHDDTDDLCRRLGTEHDVLLVPGSCFGHPDRVRLGFGGPSGDFAEGLARLGAVLAAAHPSTEESDR